MFDIGFWEISLIFIVGLLILGPERMPRVARTAGLFLGRARAAMRKLQREVQRELMLEETRAAVDEARKTFDEPVIAGIRPTTSGDSGAPAASEPGPGPLAADTESEPRPASTTGEPPAPGIEPRQRDED